MTCILMCVWNAAGCAKYSVVHQTAEKKRGNSLWQLHSLFNTLNKEEKHTWGLDMAATRRENTILLFFLHFFVLWLILMLLVMAIECICSECQWLMFEGGSTLQMAALQALLWFGCDKEPGTLRAVAAATVDPALSIFGDSFVHVTPNRFNGWWSGWWHWLLKCASLPEAVSLHGPGVTNGHCYYSVVRD